jgi:hypothetical protein
MKNNPQRRRFLRHTTAAAALLATGTMPPALAAATPAEPAAAPGDPWQRARQIVERCSRPLAFPKVDFPITAFGARSCARRRR